MLKKSLAVFMLVMFTSFNALKADEGMWLLMHIKGMLYKDMKKKGLKLKPEDIYNVNGSSLKDAIVSFGGFCTGEIISSQGLLLTNHHCGYGAIQSNSTEEHNYLRDGFWAFNKEQEIAIPDLYVSILDRMDDVTAEVLKGIPTNATEEERAKLVAENISRLTKEAGVDGINRKFEIAEMFDGNEYYSFTFNVYNDIRMVGTPPESIGKFGGDTDNWMWPRHTVDFSMFRIYADKDNNPAQYSANNVPLAPKHHLPVSIKGVEEGDYSMIMGFPGSTDRYMTSWEVEDAINVDQPARVKIRTAKLENMKEGMDANEGTRIKYAAKYAQTANYWKYFQGQTKGLKKLHVYDTKKELENKFNAWIKEDAAREVKYSTTLQNLGEGLTAQQKYTLVNTYFGEAIYGSEINKFIFEVFGNFRELGNPNLTPEQKDGIVAGIRASGKAYFKDFDLETSKAIYAALLEMYYNDVPAEMHGNELPMVADSFKGDFTAYTDMVYANSVFGTEANFNAFLDNLNPMQLQTDPAITMLMSIYMVYSGARDMEAGDKISKGKREFAAGIREMNSEKTYYPNANSTIRLTYGNVLSYEPFDGAEYEYYTTEKGFLEKEDNSVEEFVVFPEFKELLVNKDFGQYGNKDGSINVGFISNNDITGGNSGSPVINAKGELIGTAFDGNWEAMSGDIVFEPSLQRTISVDIRFVLFVIDKYAGATNLIEEMTIVK